MRLFQFIFNVLRSVFFTSATPDFFGSHHRIDKLQELSDDTEARAEKMDAEIAAERVRNPFESAAAKSAMAESSRKAKQIQQRYANMLGANNNPEALIAAQSATQEAIGSTAGDIATGAEAQKQNNINAIERRKLLTYGQSDQQQQASINQIGSGWKDFMGTLTSLGSSFGNVGTAVGSWGKKN